MLDVIAASLAAAAVQAEVTQRQARERQLTAYELHRFLTDRQVQVRASYGFKSTRYGPDPGPVRYRHAGPCRGCGAPDDLRDACSYCTTVRTA